MPAFETARLVATPVTIADTAFFRRLWADPDVAAMLGGVRDAAAVDIAISEAIEHWAAYGFGRWVLRAGDTVVGTVKLAHCSFTGRDEVELGYALLPQHWGRGYATEAAAGALAYARNHTELADVIALVLLGNTRSTSVLDRLDFQREADLHLPEGDHAVYRKFVRLPKATVTAG